eukprot:3320222-Rhodomonas_salina.3
MLHINDSSCRALLGTDSAHHDHAFARAWTGHSTRVSFLEQVCATRKTEATKAGHHATCVSHTPLSPHACRLIPFARFRKTGCSELSLASSSHPNMKPPF